MLGDGGGGPNSGAPKGACFDQGVCFLKLHCAVSA